MKYSELQAIADAIINSNEKLIYLNLLVVSLAVLAVYFVALFKKSGELTAINLAFEDIKRQNRVITSETESIKRQLEKDTIEYQIKLSKYHEKKIDAIEKIHFKLSELLSCSRKILLATGETKFDEFHNAVEEFRSNFEAKKLWLDTSISNEIENFAIEVDKQVRQYQGTMNIAKLPNLNEKQVDQLHDKQQEFYEFTVRESKKLKEQLEEFLRAYISPEKKANATTSE